MMIKLIGGPRDGLTFEISKTPHIIYVPYVIPQPIVWKESAEDLTSVPYQELSYQRTDSLDKDGRRLYKYKEKHCHDQH